MATHVSDGLAVTRPQPARRRWFRRPPWPRPTVRFRLTVLYGGFFLIAGAGLLATTYLLVERSTGQLVAIDSDGRLTQSRVDQPFLTDESLEAFRETTAQLYPADDATAQELQQVQAAALRQHDDFLHQLVTQSAIALAITALAAVALGWLVAGRALRPVRTMTTAAQQISEHSLHERLALQGPGDELKDLADTIDGLLGRLETAFEAQRRFVANASHELRTPLALERALLEVTLADPNATATDLRATCQEILESGTQQEALIDALLTLASSERGLDRWNPFDLAAVTEQTLRACGPDAQRQGLQVRAELGRSHVIGNRDLAERLVANLVDNAIRYNLDGGHVDIATGTSDDRVTLTVANTGPIVPGDEVDRLFQPFQRLEAERTTHPAGHGLGLSIVQAIATAHHAHLAARPRPEGGLEIDLSFPIHLA